jgi:hypothetical protein
LPTETFKFDTEEVSAVLKPLDSDKIFCPSTFDSPSSFAVDCAAKVDRDNPKPLDRLEMEASSRPERLPTETFRFDTEEVSVVLKPLDSDVMFCPSTFDSPSRFAVDCAAKVDRDNPKPLDRLEIEASSRPERLPTETFKFDTEEVSAVLKPLDSDVMFCPSTFDSPLRFELDCAAKVDNDDPKVLERLKIEASSLPERFPTETFKSETEEVSAVLKPLDSEFRFELVFKARLDKDASKVLDRPISEVDRLLDSDMISWPSKFDKPFRLELD